MIFNGMPLTGLTLPHFFSSPMPGSEFPRPYAMFFFSSLNGLRSEVIVRFVDIGGIVDHHCLIFLFIAILSVFVLFSISKIRVNQFISYFFSYSLIKYLRNKA
jgi:hypothetical protein